jgi:hypothetical protein
MTTAPMSLKGGWLADGLLPGPVAPGPLLKDIFLDLYLDTDFRRDAAIPE